MWKENLPLGAGVFCGVFGKRARLLFFCHLIPLKSTEFFEKFYAPKPVIATLEGSEKWVPKPHVVRSNASVGYIFTNFRWHSG